jgi:hypothetical protein
MHFPYEQASRNADFGMRNAGDVNGIPFSFTCVVARCILGIDDHGA